MASTPLISYPILRFITLQDIFAGKACPQSLHNRSFMSSIVSVGKAWYRANCQRLKDIFIVKLEQRTTLQIEEPRKLN